MTNTTESIIAAIAASGRTATVIVMDEQQENGAHVPFGQTFKPPQQAVVGHGMPVASQAPASPQDDDRAVMVAAEMEKMRQGYERQLAALTSQLDGIKKENESIKDKLKEAQVRLQDAQTSDAGEVTSDVPMETGVSVDEFDVEVLGLSERAHKRALGAGYKTVGALREAYLSKDLKDTKLTKDELIEIGEKLLGRVPAERIPSSEPASADKSSATNGASDVPSNIDDRGWMARLNVLLFKSQKAREAQAALEEYEDKNKAFVKRWKATHDKYADLKADVEVAKGQVVAMLYSMNLDFKLSAEDALDQVGLGHLIPKEDQE